MAHRARWPVSGVWRSGHGRVEAAQTSPSDFAPSRVQFLRMLGIWSRPELTRARPAFESEVVPA